MSNSVSHLPPDLEELIALNRSLRSLVEPLKLLLEKGQQPDAMERINAILQEIENVGTQTRNAAEAMARALSSQDLIEERLEGIEKIISAMSQDVRYLRREVDGQQE